MAAELRAGYLGSVLLCCRLDFYPYRLRWVRLFNENVFSEFTGNIVSGNDNVVIGAT
jgi:hypothetical protein